MRVRFIAGASVAAAIFCAAAATVRADDFPTDGTGCQNLNSRPCGSATANTCVRWEEITYYPLGISTRTCAEWAEVQSQLMGPHMTNAD